MQANADRTQQKKNARDWKPATIWLAIWLCARQQSTRGLRQACQSCRHRHGLPVLVSPEGLDLLCYLERFSDRHHGSFAIRHSMKRRAFAGLNVQQMVFGNPCLAA
jgi:hypothetical protein